MNRRLVARIALPVETVAEVEAIYDQIPKVSCKGECQECCCPVGNLMTEFERDRIIKRVGYRPNELPLHKVGTGERVQPCNLLTKDGKCSVYDIRPTVCRLWGAESAMPCKNGCEGSGVIPKNGGYEFVRRVKAACRNYDSPLPERVRRGEGEAADTLG